MKKTNWNILFVAVLVIAVLGVGALQNSSPQTIKTNSTISGTRALILSEQDLQQLGMTSDLNESDLQQFGINTGTNCQTDENYGNIVDSSLGQHTICVYSIPALNATQVIIQLTKFVDYESLNGSYQYSSSHLYSSQGLLSENTFGDLSRFRVNNVNDYGGQFNPPGVYYYHLWIAKNLYLIDISSSGPSQDAAAHIANIGQQILAKF